MVRLERGVILSSLTLVLVRVSPGLSSQVLPRQRLRKHRSQVFHAPKKGERRKGSHKNSYQQDEDLYPSNLPGFYEYNEDTTLPHAKESLTRVSSANNNDYDHGFHVHSHDSYYATYQPTTYYPTIYPTFEEPIVYEYTGKYSKGGKHSKSRGKEVSDTQQAKQTAYTSHQKKSKGGNHGLVHESVFEDSNEETPSSNAVHEEVSFSPDAGHVPGGLDMHRVPAAEHMAPESEPHHHHHAQAQSLGYGPQHQDSTSYSHSQDPSLHNPTRHPSTQGPNSNHVPYCNNKGSKKTSKSKMPKGEYHHYQEPLEIVNHDCTVLPISRSKKAKARGKKSKSKGPRSIAMRTAQLTHSHRTPLPTINREPTSFVEVTSIPTSQIKWPTPRGNKTDMPTEFEPATDQDSADMGPPLPQPTEPIPAETMEPSSATPRGVAVELIPFGLLWDIDRGRSPTMEEHIAASAVVEEYINIWFSRGYNREAPTTSVYVQDSAALMLGNTLYSLISGSMTDYSGSADFQDNFVIPPSVELDMSLAMAFAEPYLQDFLDLLATELPSENIMSTATSIRYTENSEVGQGGKRRSPSKLGKGILMAAAFGMLGLLLYGGGRMYVEFGRQNTIRKTGAFFRGDDILTGGLCDCSLIAS